VQKRSLTISGHRTSIALEPEFWEAAEALALSRRLPLATLIREIDEAREAPNLSSAVRVAILKSLQDRAGP
jgi:predicted DNA-binding ribbon-helix-helix protein